MGQGPVGSRPGFYNVNRNDFRLTSITVPLDGSELEEEASEYLQGVSNRLTAREINTSATILKGSPAISIMDNLRNTPDTLVAICTHGRSGLGRVLIGSIADSIIRSSGAPVLIITPQ